VLQQHGQRRRPQNGMDDGMDEVYFYGTEELAERVGFEPTLELPLNTLSKRAPSATRPSLRLGCTSKAGTCVDAGPKQLYRTLALERSQYGTFAIRF
jgi:hypothetical protein